MAPPPQTQGKEQQQFEEAVKPALESLLDDLQRTTEVLRRGKRYQQQQNGVGEAGGRGGDDFAELRRMGGGGGSSATGGSRQTGSGAGIGFSSPAQRQLRELSSAASSGQHPPMAENEQSSAAGGRRDPMLDGDSLGIHTIPKGDCGLCQQPVIGPVVIALGRMWHPEHFCCAHCGDQIGHRNFFERQGKAYCESDFHDLFSPRCHYCNGPVKERCVTALGGKTFHVEHFVCTDCGRPFGEEGFHERAGSALCRDCFSRQYAPKCQACKKPITHKFVTALNTHWHPECFCCQDCGRPFGSASLFDHIGRPLCELCFHGRQGSLCAHCQMPIAGRCVFALGRKFHPEHFFCCYCNRQLAKGDFKECQGRAYCLRCFQLIGR